MPLQNTINGQNLQKMKEQEFKISIFDKPRVIQCPRITFNINHK